MSDLKTLRAELDQLDAQLIETIAKRQAVVAEIGRVKEGSGKQLRDYRREAEVLANVRNKASAAALDPSLAENVMKQIIEASLVKQEQRRVHASNEGHDKRALILGGNGKMGRWFASFLDAQGFDIFINDPSGCPAEFSSCPDWQAQIASFDVIVIAAQIRATVNLLTELEALKPRALIFDIGSLKSPLKSSLRSAAAKGLKICSVHPMFGPDTHLLSDRHVIFIDLGMPAAVSEAKSMFGATSAELVDMALDEHDELIAYVLGVSHALNIVFFTALANSGNSAPKLAKLSSTTFDRQLAIASRVAEENPRLYFEIQHLNDARELGLGALEKALAQLTRCVREGDEIGFVAMMERGRGYLSARASVAGKIGG
jgi:chorismate mutase / prephenate dehydrogenase